MPIHSPANFLGLIKPLRSLYAASDDAVALGLDDKVLSHGCSVCNGRGSIRIDMGFLPDVHAPCETCRGTGLLPEAWEVRLRLRPTARRLEVAATPAKPAFAGWIPVGEARLRPAVVANRP